MEKEFMNIRVISDIHIKDRLLGGGPVKLGTGNTDIYELFSKLKMCEYKARSLCRLIGMMRGYPYLRSSFNGLEIV